MPGAPGRRISRFRIERVARWREASDCAAGDQGRTVDEAVQAERSEGAEVRHDTFWLDKSVPMRSPLDSYGPEPESGPPFDPRGTNRFRWVQWAQLGLSSALLVLFLNQLIQLQDVNRRIARLYERMEQLEGSRMTDTTPALEAQQIKILQRLQQLENSLRDLELESRSSESSSGAPAFMAPPQPPAAPR